MRLTLPAVASFTIICPALTAPALKSSAAVSEHPAMTGRPSGRPVSAATSARTLPTISFVPRISGRTDSGSPIHVVLGEHEAADLRVAFRLVLPDPEQLRKRPGRRRHLHAYAEYLASVFGFKAIALVAASLVVPHYARADDLARLVHEDGVVRGGRYGERKQAVEAVLHLLAAGFYCFYKGVYP